MSCEAGIPAADTEVRRGFQSTRDFPLGHGIVRPRRISAHQTCGTRRHRTFSR
ncbi:Hypothetical protein A7982_07332 [Minicystis rosea]|nr:Hypothetical protein A7982_07332 [Minicystis rosea]